MTQMSFPELYTLRSESLRHDWCNGYLNTMLQRDVKALMEIDKLARIPDMLKLLASRNGGVLNEAGLSRDMELNHITTKKYRSLLESLFLTLSLPAWSANLGKRLIKSPKIYLGDINILLYLLNMPLQDLSLHNPMLWGQIVENFVAIELFKQQTFSSVRTSLYYYRTSAGQEIDFLLEGPRGELIALEVKAKSKVTEKDFRHIIGLKKVLKDKLVKGFVIYTGNETVSFGPHLFSIPLQALWKR